MNHSYPHDCPGFPHCHACPGAGCNHRHDIRCRRASPWSAAPPSSSPTRSRTRPQDRRRRRAGDQRQLVCDPEHRRRAQGAADKFNHRLRADGAGKIGTVDQQPIALSGQYHFGTADQVMRPFVAWATTSPTSATRPSAPTARMSAWRPPRAPSPPRVWTSTSTRPGLRVRMPAT